MRNKMRLNKKSILSFFVAISHICTLLTTNMLARKMLIYRKSFPLFIYIKGLQLFQIYVGR